MWDSTSELLNGGGSQRVVLRSGGAAVSYGEVLRCWRDDEAFRTFFVGLLAAAPFAAYRWETPPVTAATAGREFEFVLLDDPGLNRRPDPHAFAEQFRANRAGASVVAFVNLGKDAVLVVPRPAGPASAYGHLPAFIRHAPDAQKHDLWRAVGAEMEARLGARPVWLSTAGMGVPWLHVRLDSRPKYYGFAPYKQAPV